MKKRISKASFIHSSIVKELIRDLYLDIDNPYDEDYLLVCRVQCVDESSTHIAVYFSKEIYYSLK